MRELDHSWFGTVGRAVLEAHFGRGTLAVADRRPDFTRVYDLAERIVPAEHLAKAIESRTCRARALASGRPRARHRHSATTWPITFACTFAMPGRA